MMKSIETKLNNIDNLNVSLILSVLCGIIHVVYFIMFAIMNVWTLAFYNILSVVFYIILSLVCIKRPKIFLIAIVEIITSAFFSDLRVGEGSGFKLIFLIIIPVIFFVLYLNKIQLKISVFSVICVFISYIILLILEKMDFFNEVVKLDTTKAFIISLFNALVVFAIMLGVSVLFIYRIKQKEAGLEHQNERLSKLANVDPLTELLNRRSINQKLELSMQRKINLNVDFTVAIADIDNFKDLNDVYGHDCGDKVLKNIAEEIRRAVRDTDYVCRWGGEEILILFCGSGQEASGRVLERIRKNIEENGGVYEGSRISVTMTFGVSSSESDSTIKDIILKADRNLYQGKKSGKNCIVYS